MPSFNRQEIHLTAALTEPMAVTAKTQGAGRATVGTEASPAGGTNVEVVRPRNQDPPTAFADTRSQPGAEAARVTSAQSHARNPCARSLRSPAAGPARAWERSNHDELMPELLHLIEVDGGNSIGLDPTEHRHRLPQARPAASSETEGESPRRRGRPGRQPTAEATPPRSRPWQDVRRLERRWSSREPR